MKTDCCRTESPSWSPEPVWAALQFRNWEVSSSLRRLPGATISFTEKENLPDQLPCVTHCLPSCTIGKEILLWGHGLCCTDTTDEFQPDLPSSAHGCFCHQGPVSPGMWGGGQETSELPLHLGSLPSGNFGQPSLRTEGQRHPVPFQQSKSSVTRNLGKQGREGRRLQCQNVAKRVPGSCL